MEWEQLENTTRLRTLIRDVGTHPSRMSLPKAAWVRLNHLRTSVGRSRSCLQKWGVAPSAACERGIEEQTDEHVVLHCHRPSHGVHGFTVLVKRQSDSCSTSYPEIYSVTKQWIERTALTTKNRLRMNMCS